MKTGPTSLLAGSYKHGHSLQVSIHCPLGWRRGPCNHTSKNILIAFSRFSCISLLQRNPIRGWWSGVAIRGKAGVWLLHSRPQPPQTATCWQCRSHCCVSAPGSTSVGASNAVAGGSAWRGTMRRSHVHTLKTARKERYKKNTDSQIHGSTNSRSCNNTFSFESKESQMFLLCLIRR